MRYYVQFNYKVEGDNWEIVDKIDNRPIGVNFHKIEHANQYAVALNNVREYELIHEYETAELNRIYLLN